jgi:predicted nucleic-acid-binding Zn-ribbon protein
MKDMVCPKCGNDLYENSMDTVFEYNKDIKLLMCEDGNLEVENAPKYMVFSCIKCGFRRRVSFEDYFRSRQETVLKTLGKIRSDSCVRTLDHSIKYSEDSGVLFCGLCPGLFDGDGMCTNDVINNCFVRKRLLEN